MDVREIERQIDSYTKRETEALKEADKLEQETKRLRGELEKQKEKVREEENELRKIENELVTETDKQTKYINIVLLNKKVVTELRQKKQRLEDDARKDK